ncbi:hypothetical protein Y1Q_0022974 [Alligator mississippiensis]|uniref:Uncharacterized protein n=1 Tax=Alligator mississippiensis TaxID=8496 RepID=A0A151P7K6_ALLMI|nr:hypothetical protein Y1Q_0022974 [Alligator mississippiensis]
MNMEDGGTIDSSGRMTEPQPKVHGQDNPRQTRCPGYAASRVIFRNILWAVLAMWHQPAHSPVTRRVE